MVRKILIIGMGVAGISAVETIRSHDTSCEISMISKDDQGYYSLPGLAYFLANEVPDWQLMPFKEADFQNLGIHRIYGIVKRLEPTNHVAVTSDGENLKYDQLLLATGSAAVRPDLPGNGLHGVVFLDSLEDARLIKQLSKRVKKAAVVGGGITAIEIVEGLVEQGLQVHYFLRGERYWSNVLNETESEIIERRLKKSGVRLHYHSELAEITRSNNEVRGVTTRSGEQIECGMVAIAVGVLPRKRAC